MPAPLPTHPSKVQPKTLPKQIKLSDEKLRLVVYGEPGSGKTTLALGFPKPLVIDTDFGLISVAYAAEDGADIGESWTPAGSRDLAAMGDFIATKVRTGAYETVVIDSLDTLCDQLITELVHEHAAADVHNRRPLLMENIPEQIEYLGNRNQVREFLWKIASLGCHVVVTAGARKVGDPVPNRTVPDVAPSIVQVVGKWGSIVGELQAGIESPQLTKGPHRLLLTETGPARLAKSRFADHRPYVVDPTFDSLWAPVAARFARSKKSQAKPE